MEGGFTFQWGGGVVFQRGDSFLYGGSMRSIGFDGFSKKKNHRMGGGHLPTSPSTPPPPPTLWETLHISYYLMQAMEGDFLKFKE